MNTTQSIIEITNMRKRFGKIIALNSLTLGVPIGIFGLIGPNGAGKTTLLRILLGLLRQDAGRAIVYGHDTISESVEIRRKTGVLHEHPMYPKSLRVGQYLSHVSELYETHQDSENLLSTVGLENAMDMKIGNLSAGMRQRLGIAQALIGNPKLLILDEPTSNLDVFGRMELLQMITKIHQDTGVSILISSHVLSELERVCTHVGFIHKGSLVETGPLLDVLQKYSGNHLRLSVLDPSSIIEQIRDIEGVVSVEVAGTNSLTISFSDVSEEDIRFRLSHTADRLGFEVYTMERISSLELAFREVIKR